MKSIAAALSAAMFCLMSCVNLSTGDGNQNNGGNPKDDTPSSKDDEPKKDDSGDVYVLDAADGEFIKNDGSRFSYRYFEKPVYITPEWSKVPVLQSYAGSYPLDNLDFELELVYSYPSNVLMYEDGEYLLKIGLIYDGYSCRVGALMDVDGNDCISCQYDSKERLSKLTWYYRDGAYEEEYVNVFSYDDQSRLSEIKLTSENEDCTTLISFEYSSIPSKTVYPLQLVNAESVFCEVLVVVGFFVAFGFVVVFAFVCSFFTVVVSLVGSSVVISSVGASVVGSVIGAVSGSVLSLLSFEETETDGISLPIVSLKSLPT